MGEPENTSVLLQNKEDKIRQEHENMTPSLDITFALDIAQQKVSERDDDVSPQYIRGPHSQS